MSPAKKSALAPFAQELVAAIEENRVGLPELARAILRLIVAQLNDTQAKVRQIEAKLTKWHATGQTETGACQPNPRECRGFSHTGK